METRKLTVIAALIVIFCFFIAACSNETAAPVTKTETVATPTAAPPAGTYSSVQSVTLASATSGASIYYTIDGSTPAASSALYLSNVEINASCTLKAIAVKEGMIDSGILSAEYIVTGVGSATVSITFAQISDSASSISVDIPVLHRVDGQSSAVLTLANAAQYDANSVSWRVNGVVIGTGSSVTLNASNSVYNTFGTHYLMISVQKAGVSYNKTIPFTVEY